MGLTLITPPTVFPVSLEEAKEQLRVTSDREDALIEGYIRAATKHLEQRLDMSLAQQTWKLTLDRFTDAIELPRGPVSAVTSVSWFGLDGAEAAVDPDLYSTDLLSDRQWVVLNAARSWPDTLDAVNAVSVTYNAGFETVPDDLRHAILLLVAHWHATRAAASEKAMSQVPFAVDCLTDPYRRISL